MAGKVSSLSDQAGLKWVESTFGDLVTLWTKEPSLDAVRTTACHHLGLPSDLETTIDFLSQGAFNKIYKITCPIGEFVMRVSLPVDPYYKTTSEAATLDLVHSRTTIPVPKVIAHNASNRNEIGFEWILMEYVPGVTLDEAWATMTWAGKCKLVEKLVDISMQLFQLRSDQIGNIYRADESVSNISNHIFNGPAVQSDYMVRRIVSMPFFRASRQWASRQSADVHRGPFNSCTDWLTTRLALLKHDTDQPLPSDADSDDEKARVVDREAITRLLQLMPLFFPADAEGNNDFGLHHDDMSRRNIMVDPHTGELAALVDWECVSVVPLWKVCQLPQFLVSRERTSEPQKHDYFHQGNEGDTAYFDDLEEYEKTCLRRHFLEQMARLEPAWMEIHDLSTAKVDFDFAVEHCHSLVVRKIVMKWLKNVAAGREQESIQVLRWGY